MLALLSTGPGGWGDELLAGAAMTLAVALLSYLLGVALGAVLAMARLANGRAPRLAASAYVTVLRGVPPLLVIWMLFFGGSAAVTSAARLAGYRGWIELSAFVVGVAAVALGAAAYAAEALRGAVLAVPRGQLEAARALGMSRFLLFRRILTPLALRHALPALGNVWQMTLKDTTLVSVTALAELMRVAQIAGLATRQPFLFYAAAALLYLLLSAGSAALFRVAERRAERGVRRAA
jgi:octopine/nopaline transport system permease protein